MFVFDKDSELRKIKISTFSLTALSLRSSMLGLSHIVLISVLFYAIFQHVDAHAAMM
jgi:hypothetical protein